MLTVLGLVGETENTIRYVILAMQSLGCPEQKCLRRCSHRIDT